MPFNIILTETAMKQREELRSNPALEKRYKAVKKSVQLLANNPRHPSLNTHEYTSLSKELGKKVFEAYAENRTPGAYRIFWHYGDEKGTIVIISIIPHP